jgi:hypothetical protein
VWGWPAHWRLRKCVHTDSISQLTTTCQKRIENGGLSDPERGRISNLYAGSPKPGATVCSLHIDGV